MKPPANISIVIVDDQALFRSGLAALFRLLPGEGICQVAEAKNGAEAISAVAAHKPDVVLMDVQMPGMNGIEATARIKQQYPRTGVIALSLSVESEAVFSMLDAGADGYVSKNSSMDELALAVRTVCNGGLYVCTALRPYMDRWRSHQKAISHQFSPHLTRREQEVLPLICQGKTSSQIAKDLSVSKRTIDTIRMHIMQKTATKSAVDLLHYAYRQGLFTLK